MKENLLFEKLGIGTGNIELVGWIVITLGILLLFYFSSLLCRKVIIPLVRLFTKKTRSNWDDILLSDRTLKDVCNLVPAIVIALIIPFVMNSGTIIYTFFTRVCWVYITGAGVKLTCSVLSSLYKISHQAERTKDHTLQGVFQMLKIVAICIGAIIIVSILLDKDPTKLLAGLGASAAVLMLVFKDSIMGLVAGVQLSANDMLRPGDWIEMPKYGADGVVIDVTLTTIKVQNWDNTITTIPPYNLVSDSFQNWRGMFDSGGRRIKRSLFIDMNSVKFCDKELIKQLSEEGLLVRENPEQEVNLTLFREWLEEWLQNHPKVNKEMIIMVRQLQPTPQGVPLELYFFFDGTAWVHYEHFQAEVFEYILALVHKFRLKVFQAPAGYDFKKVSQA